MGFLEFYGDVAPQLVLACTLVMLLRRKLLKVYPFFFSLVVFQVVEFAVALVVYRYAVSDPAHRSRLYKWTATSGLAIGSIFDFGVLYELTDKLLLSRIKRWEGFRAFLQWTAGMLVLITSLASTLLAQTNLARVLAIFQTLNFSINLIKAAFLLVMISLTRVLSISWKGLSAGIALGLGISAAADVEASWLMSQASNISSGTVDMIRMGGFQICVVVWLAYIVRRGETCELSGNDLPPFDVEASVQELQRITQR